MSILGTRVVRTEDPRLLTVGGTYVDDLRVPELADAARVTFVRSPVAHARITGIDTTAARRWAGPAGSPAAFDATGAAAATAAMVGMVASGGRAVQVGMSNEEAPIRVGLLTEKELDLLGVSCCGEQEFADAVAATERNGPLLSRLVSHEFGLGEAPEAIRFAISHPAQVMKVVIRC